MGSSRVRSGCVVAVGDWLGASVVGEAVGERVGDAVGDAVGERVGGSVGSTKTVEVMGNTSPVTAPYDAKEAELANGAAASAARVDWKVEAADASTVADSK
jgi:hypothetical protein